MQERTIEPNLRKYLLFTLPHLFFTAEVANLLRHNIFLSLNNPFYYIHRIYNIEFIFIFASFLVALILRYQMYIDISFRKYFIYSLISKLLFFISFKITLSIGFGFTLLYSKNFFLFSLFIIFSSLMDYFYYDLSTRKIKKYDPKGIIVLFVKEFLSLVRKSHYEVLLPLFVSVFFYAFLTSLFHNMIGKKVFILFKLFNLLFSLFFCYVSSFFYYFFTNALVYFYDYNICNMEIYSLNEVKFNELPVHSYYFNKITSGYLTEKTKLKILKTKSIINYLRMCLKRELSEIIRIFIKIEESYEYLENEKYYFVPVINKIDGLETKDLYRKIPTNKFMSVIVAQIQTLVLNRIYQHKLNNLYVSFNEMYSFVVEADQADCVFKLMNDLKKEMDKEINNLKKLAFILEQRTHMDLTVRIK